MKTQNTLFRRFSPMLLLLNVVAYFFSGTNVYADPFAFELSGTWSFTSDDFGGGAWPGGPDYTITVVLDNGGTSAANQVYEHTDVVALGIVSGAYVVLLTETEVNVANSALTLSSNAAGELVISAPPPGPFVIEWWKNYTDFANEERILLGRSSEGGGIGMVEWVAGPDVYAVDWRQQHTSTPGVPFGEDPDTDGDGIPDDDDACPESDLNETVVIDGIGTGVENHLFDDGCTMSDLISLCAVIAETHGDFVSCVSHLTNQWKKDGLISGKEKGRIQSAAAKAFR